MKNSNYYFSKRVLLIEFLIREQKFYGKGNVRTTLPPDSFFYTGKSKADGYASPLICFDDNKPYLLKEITEEKFNKIFTENTNIVCSTSEEYVDKNNKWHRSTDELKSNKTNQNGNQGQFPYHNFKSISPYNFNIVNIDEDGKIETNFPNEQISLFIEVGQTLCFLCRREEYSFGEWYYPNLNLVLFVKNYGWHDNIEFRSQKDIDRLSLESQLCNGKFDLRDFRKSSMKYELG
ncbi:MAG: hypothetical protein E6767_12990 [Dysgonomonas sp.]|nr:hypothetical protein [Dysgonomonas sp.]